DRQPGRPDPSGAMRAGQLAVTGAPRQAVHEDGFTLVEVLIALLVFVVGIAAIAGLFAVVAKTNVSAKMTTATASAGLATLDGLNAQPFDRLVPGGSLDADRANYFSDVTVAGGEQVHCRWEIVQIDAQTLFIRIRSEAFWRPARTELS